MRVVIRQTDLDTVVTAFVCGVSGEDEIVAVQGRASEADLADPAVLCIEVGGSGDVGRRNFDHHDAGGPEAVACRQALLASARNADAWLERLVCYGEMVDVGRPVDYRIPPGFGLITLSALVSGVRIVERGPECQLRRALGVLDVFRRERLDPFDAVAVRPEWLPLVEAKRAAIDDLAAAIETADEFLSKSGARVGFATSMVPGPLGALYQRGCDVAVAFNPQSRKYSIGGRDGRRVDHLLPLLNAIEGGWGGPTTGTIIGSPFGGSCLQPETVKQLLRTYL